MRLLLDTHAFLWFLAGDPKLSPAARGFIEDIGNEPLLSVASAWELAIKVSIGKLTYVRSLPVLLQEDRLYSDIALLSITIDHVLKVATLPFPGEHKGPFDRLLVAQCLVDNLPIVSADAVLDSYDVQRLW